MTDQINKLDKHRTQNIDNYLKLHQSKSLLRLITCGSVDDGKSTLIGRLLYDSKVISEDQLEQLHIDSRRIGTQGQEIDFALLVDGLSAEREQGITIDVCYRFFDTEKRKFVIADTPGHEQYTRNMVTGASTAQLAIILVDARKGILTQTRRHSYICNLLGIKNIVLAINKMDLVEYNKDVFENIITDYTNFCNSIGISSFKAIPISGLKGDNITTYSKATPWFNGPTLMEHLENVEIFQDIRTEQNFSMPVQWVNRPNSDFRGFSGKVASGKIKPGDKVYVAPSEIYSYVDRIVTFDGDLDCASVDQSIILTFSHEVDCSRGQIIVGSKTQLEVADQFETTLIWMGEKTLMPGRSYYLKIGTLTVSATVAEPKYQINLDNMQNVKSKTLELNAIGVANITTDRPIPFAPYSENKVLGGFILIDKMTNATVSAGLINFALSRSQNIHWQTSEITRNIRANIKKQRPAVILLTGLSGSGKSTIGNAVEKKLVQMNYHTFLLDGDNVRHGLNKDLGFTDPDRIENIRRAGEVAKLMSDAGLIVLMAFIAPFYLEREMLRNIIEPGEFVEIFVDTPLSVAEERDIKGLYAKARSRNIKNFTGIDSPYEKPINPEIHVDTTKTSINEAANLIIKYLLDKEAIIEHKDNS